MNYFLKIYGYTKSSRNSATFDAPYFVNGKETTYYNKNEKIFFGENLPTRLSIGDILIQYVPLSQKVDKAGRVLGVFKATSLLKKGEIHDGKKEWVNYIEVENLNMLFSQRARKENLLNMRNERHKIEFPTGEIAKGWAYLSEKDAHYLIDRISSMS